MAKKNPWFDKWAKKAKEKGFPARSVFKLEEIQKKYKILKPNFIVLDLGCAPGAWSKFALTQVMPKGKVVGIDIQDAKISHPNFFFLKKDVFELKKEDFKALDIEKFDVILSDMAPKTTGNKFVDHINSYHLAKRAFELAKEFLKPKGSLVIKIFEGEKLPSFRKEIAKSFKNVKLFKPKSSRKESKEIFIIALELK